MVTTSPQDVAFAVARTDVEQGVPAADVGPAKRALDHGGAIGALHHRIVDRLLRRAGEGVRLEAEEAEIGGGASNGSLDRLGHFRFELRQLGEQDVGAKQEVA